MRPEITPFAELVFVFLCLSLFLEGAASVRAADRKILPGHVPEIATLLPSTGRLAATNQMRLAIGLPLRDPAGLADLVAKVSDPRSPNFRRYLSREEVTARFGPTEADYSAVKDFVRANGLTIAVEHKNRLLLDVVGPAAAVENAFHVKLLKFHRPGGDSDFFAPDAEPTVDLALPVADISGLSDYSRPRAKLARGKGARAIPLNGSAPDGSGDLFGNDFRNAYAPGTSLTGAGQSVGLVEFAGFFTNNIIAYAQAAGNGRTNISVQAVLLDGYNGNPGDASSDGDTEVALDIEMAMSIAPGLSQIISYEAGPGGFPNDVLNAMLANSNVVNLSCSWGWAGGPSATTDAIFMSMDAVGQTFFDASGDDKAFTSGSGSVNGVDNPSRSNAPSSNPFITQVGGTTMSMNGSGASWSSEVVWNWSAEGELDVGSSGGISSYYAIPTWQTNVHNLTGHGGSATTRNIPDVAANADHVYVIYGTGKGDVEDGVGGTSCAAPMWAGFMALVNQQLSAQGQPPAGFINPAIYALAATANYTNCFHDVTIGSNTWSSSVKWFYAFANYDLCTGLGAMNGTNLINALAPPPAAPAFLPSVQSGRALTLSWNAVPGYLYQVQYTTDPSTTNWINFGSPLAATGTVQTISDVLTNSRRFYRVVAP